MYANLSPEDFPNGRRRNVEPFRDCPNAFLQGIYIGCVGFHLSDEFIGMFRIPAPFPMCRPSVKVPIPHICLSGIPSKIYQAVVGRIVVGGVAAFKSWRAGTDEGKKNKGMRRVTLLATLGTSPDANIQPDKSPRWGVFPHWFELRPRTNGKAPLSGTAATNEVGPEASVVTDAIADVSEEVQRAVGNVGNRIVGKLVRVRRINRGHDQHLARADCDG